MLKKKICLLGAPAVGKTSLVARFVRSIYSENYHATVGAKVDKKVVEIPGGTVELMIWDMAGDSAERLAHSPYVRGAAGHLVVCDGTRPETIEESLRLLAEVRSLFGDVPMVTVVNKSDLVESWKATPDVLAPLEKEAGLAPITTSARSGQRVEEAFATLARRISGVG
ncbi:MAG: GTP-binding protein [Verrucomicrobia bacterium]|nr:GTP-binding protein [Verrucomicrobiota bacterium]